MSEHDTINQFSTLVIQRASPNRPIDNLKILQITIDTLKFVTQLKEQNAPRANFKLSIEIIMATFLFDFDGTIADSLSLVCYLIEKYADYLKCKHFTATELLLLKELHAREVLNYLDIPFWRVASFVRKLRKITNQYIEEITIFPGWADVLKTLRDNQHQIGLISSNSQQNVAFVLKKYDLIDLFDFISCDKSLFGKKRCLQKLIRQKNITPAMTYYVGDEVRDIEAAFAVKIHTIAVSWGFNSFARLKLANPEHLISDIEQLTSIYSRES